MASPVNFPMCAALASCRSNRWTNAASRLPKAYRSSVLAMGVMTNRRQNDDRVINPLARQQCRQVAPLV